MADAAPQMTTPIADAPIAAIERMLAAEKAPPPAPKQPQQAAQPAAQEQIPAQPEAQPEEEVPAGPNTQTEGDDAPQEDAPAKTAEIPLDQLEAIALEVTVKGEDGKDAVEKPTIKELREGYMRQKDYSRKTAEVARQREEVGTQVRQAIEGERKQALETIQQVQALLIETAAPELKDVNWNDLAANDPFKYVQLRNRADQIASALQAIQAKKQELEGKQKTESETVRKQAATKAWETLQKDIPGWSDATYQSVINSADEFGYKKEEVANWLDPRAIRLLYAAKKAKAEAPQKPSNDKRVVVPPKVVKPGAQVDASAQRRATAMGKLQKTGSLDDAASVIRSLIR